MQALSMRISQPKRPRDILGCILRTTTLRRASISTFSTRSGLFSRGRCQPLHSRRYWHGKVKNEAFTCTYMQIRKVVCTYVQHCDAMYPFQILWLYVHVLCSVLCVLCCREDNRCIKHITDEKNLVYQHKYGLRSSIKLLLRWSDHTWNKIWKS